jgi:hypothetical protein
MNAYVRMLAAKVYRPGDYIDWPIFLAYRIKPRIRVKMGRA